MGYNRVSYFVIVHFFDEEAEKTVCRSDVFFGLLRPRSLDPRREPKPSPDSTYTLPPDAFERRRAMGCKLSHVLLDTGWFCALGTSEHPGAMRGEGHLVPLGTPFTHDYNNRRERDLR